jgi:hypothetical protein
VIFRFKALIALGLVVAMSSTAASAARAQTVCADGTPADNILSCKSSPAAGDLDLDLGNDTLTFYGTASAANIQGDGVASSADPMSQPPHISDPQASVAGGIDKITVYGIVTNEVSGDYLWQANGGADTINVYTSGNAYAISGDTIFAAVDNHTGDGGADVIRISGKSHIIRGDNVPGNGGADKITVDRGGVVASGVIGDVAQLNGGNDEINIYGTVTGVTVEGEFYPGTVSGDQALGQGGADRISINGLVDGNVYGDEWVLNGGRDTITVRGTVTGSVDGDFQGTKGGDDTINVYGTVGGTVSGDTAVNGGNDRIIVGGSVGGDVRGDALYGTGIGGNDQITLQGSANVAGVIDGEGGRDILTFKLTGDAAGDAAIAAAVAAQSPSGSITYNGHTYRWQNFEEIRQVAATAQSGEFTRSFSFTGLIGALFLNYDWLGVLHLARAIG